MSKIMVSTKPMGLKPSTDFGGRQVKDHSTELQSEQGRPGTFNNVKKRKRSSNAQE